MTTTAEQDAPDATVDAARAIKLALALAACLVTLLVVAGQSAAGIYTVRQCDYAMGIGHHEANWQWAGTVAGGQPSVVQHSGTGCSEFGLALRNNVGGQSVTHPNGAYGGYYFYSPNGTYFTRFSGMFGTVDGCCVSGMAHYADATQEQNGSGAVSYLFQGHLPPGSFDPPTGLAGPVGRTWDSSTTGFVARRVGFYLRCGPGFNCSQGPFGDQRVRGRSFDFTLRDDIAPAVSTGGTLFAGGWVRGTRTLDFGAGDGGGGLTGVTATFDNSTTLSSASSCSIVSGRYVSFQPCPLNRSGTWNVNTATLPDGARSVTVRTTDVGGAAGQQVRTFNVDNSSPSAPTGITVAGGQGWRSTNSFDVSWSNPGGQHAPIQTAHFELCPVEPAGPCTSGQSAIPTPELKNLTLPARGSYTLRTWLEDAAGNVNPAAKSDPVTLRYDNEAPGQAALTPTSGWLNGNQSQGFAQTIGLAAGAIRPLAGIGGYSVTTNGSAPDATPDVLGDPATFTVADLPEGLSTIRARAISGAGVASGVVGETVVRVDKSPPTSSSSGAPDPAAWLRSVALVQLAGIDQPGLSGMAAAPAGAPVAAGGHIVYRVDGGPPQYVRGASTTASVSSDGRHTLSYRAVDAAGNPSDEKTIQFKIDRTAPSGSFDYQDPGDPRRLSVSVFDAASGVASGQIQYRREGAGEFRTATTQLTGGKLVARLEDVSLPDGRYEFRALVKDVAGNQSSVDQRADGRAMVLTLPLRVTTATKVVTGGGVKLSPCAAKALKKRGAKRRKAMRKCKTKKVIVAPGKAAVGLGYGKRARAVGQVTTTAGIPVPQAYVTVEAQLRTGGPFARIGAARADGQGVFRFMIPPGPSRTVRFHYEGNSTIRPSAGHLSTRVKAALTFKVNRRSVRNGERVVFKGRLRGVPVPTGGKLIVLKAKVPGVKRWKTFGTVRTNAKGVYRYPRRFTSTYGLVRYQFRAEAPREVIYSYERGISKITRVAVRGPGS